MDSSRVRHDAPSRGATQYRRDIAAIRAIVE